MTRKRGQGSTRNLAIQVSTEKISCVVQVWIACDRSDLLRWLVLGFDLHPARFQESLQVVHGQVHVLKPKRWCNIVTPWNIVDCDVEPDLRGRFMTA